MMLSSAMARRAATLPPGGAAGLSLRREPRQWTIPDRAGRQAGRRSGRGIAVRFGILPAFSTGQTLAKHADETGAAEFAEMQAIGAGDQAAFARLIERENGRLLRFARGILGNLEEAEDVVQETFMSLWENAARWKPEARIATWLHTVSYNRSIDRLRRRRNVVDARALDEVADLGEMPEAALIRTETDRSVQAAIEQLPERQRSAILLFHFQDLSQREAARIMGVSETALESLLARARRQMRLFLTAEGGDHE